MDVSAPINVEINYLASVPSQSVWSEQSAVRPSQEFMLRWRRVEELNTLTSVTLHHSQVTWVAGGNVITAVILSSCRQHPG